MEPTRTGAGLIMLSLSWLPKREVDHHHEPGTKTSEKGVRKYQTRFQKLSRTNTVPLSFAPVDLAGVSRRCRRCPYDHW